MLSENAPEVTKELEGLNLEDPDVLWSPAGDAVYFEGTLKGVQNLWKVKIDPRTLRCQRTISDHLATLPAMDDQSAANP